MNRLTLDLEPISPDIIDLRGMLHLMPDAYQVAIYSARLEGMLLASMLIVAIALAVHFWSKPATLRREI